MEAIIVTQEDLNGTSAIIGAYANKEAMYVGMEKYLHEVFNRSYANDIEHLTIATKEAFVNGILVNLMQDKMATDNNVGDVYYHITHIGVESKTPYDEINELLEPSMEIDVTSLNITCNNAKICKIIKSVVPDYGVLYYDEKEQYLRLKDNILFEDMLKIRNYVKDILLVD